MMSSPTGITTNNNNNNSNDDEDIAILVSELAEHFTCSTQNESGHEDDAHHLVLSSHHHHPHHQPPTMLKAMWSHATEWHLLPKDHYNVFGFNLFSPTQIADLTVHVFGDEENRQALAAAATPSCQVAQPGWYACFACSEYDYLFVHMDTTDTTTTTTSQGGYGTVRHYINNCNEEMPCAPSVTTLLQYVLSFIQEAKEIKELLGSEQPPPPQQPGDEWQDEAATRQRYNLEAAYAPSLQRIRTAIIESLLEEEDV